MAGYDHIDSPKEVDYYLDDKGNYYKLHNGVDIINVTKQFETKDGMVQALNPVSLHIRDKEFVAILGTSGCGKSTLLRMIGGFDQPTTGSVMFHKKEIHRPVHILAWYSSPIHCFPGLMFTIILHLGYDSLRSIHQVRSMILYMSIQNWWALRVLKRNIPRICQEV